MLRNVDLNRNMKLPPALSWGLDNRVFKQTNKQTLFERIGPQNSTFFASLVRGNRWRFGVPLLQYYLYISQEHCIKFVAF